MYSRTPYRSQVQRLVEPHRDKENVKSIRSTPQGSSRRTPMKTLNSPTYVLTPSRQPLAPVNGPGSGLRAQQRSRHGLKPSLPRIEVLRSEGMPRKLEGASTQKWSKTPNRGKRQKTKSSASTPSSANGTKRQDCVVDSITSQLFDRLMQAELGTLGHQPQASRKKNLSSDKPIQSPSTHYVSSFQDVGMVDSGFDDAVSLFVEGVISNAVQSLQREAYMSSCSIDARVTFDLCNQPSRSPARQEPTDEDISLYVDAILSVQQQIVRMEYNENLNSVMTDRDASGFHTSSDDTESSLEGKSSVIGDDSNNDSLDESISNVAGSISFEGAIPSRRNYASLSGSAVDSFASLDWEDMPFGSSPGYMLLPPRREIAIQETAATMRSESCDSQSSYEDEFLRFVHCQYLSQNTRRTASPVLQDSAVGTTPKVVGNSRRFSNIQTGMTPDMRFESHVEPMKFADSETYMTPTKFSEMSTETSEVSTHETATETEESLVQDAMVGTPLKVTSVGSDAYRQEFSDAMVGTPVKQSTTGVATSPLVQDSASYMTPIKMQSAASGTSPAKLQDSATDMPVVDMKDTSIGMSPLPTRTETAVGTSPKTTVNRESCYTPIKMHSIGMGTSPTKLQNSGTEMPAVDLMDTGVGMSPLPTRTETAVGTSPKSTVDRETGYTPIRMSDVHCGTTPLQVADSNTAMTPILLSSTHTLTSPPVVPSLRFSSSPNSLDSSKLVSHVQTAAISNQLLRTEISMLRTQKVQAEEDLTTARKQMLERQEEVAINEDRMVQLNRMGRASADKEIEDLMGQVGDQMMQIGQLDAALAEKTQMLSSLKADNEKMKKDYQQYIANLEDDLCRAYTQHQQQVSDLEAKYKKEDYERHYTRSQKRVSELEAQLDAFIQLHDTIDRTIKRENQFAAAQKFFINVKSLFMRTCQQHERVTAQVKKLEEDKEKLAGEEASWRQEMEHGERRMQENNEKMEKMMKMKEEAEEEKCKVEKELMEQTSIKEELMGKLAASHADISEKEKVLKELSNKCTILEEREVAHFLEHQNQEAAILLQAEQNKSLKAEFNQTKMSLQETIDQLHKQCQSLSTEKLSLGVDLNSSKAKIYSVEAELEDIKKMKEEQCTKISQLELELQTCRSAKADLIQTKSQLKTLEKQFRENKQFLEEERVALEESAKEVENELRITSMELSRTQASLTEAEMTRRQLQDAMSALSEQTESLQSELDHTKAQAHWMLFNQEAQISDASQAIAELCQGMTSAIASMPHPEVDMIEVASSRGFVTEGRGHRTSHRSKHPKPLATTVRPGSLVVSVLRAVDDIQTPGKESTSGEEMAQTPVQQKESYEEQRLTIGQEGASAFKAVRPSGQDGQQQVESKAGEKRSIEPLADQVLNLKTAFRRMCNIFMENEETLRKEVARLQQDMEEKDQHSKKTSQRSENQIRHLRDQLEESLSHTHQLQQSLADARNNSCAQLQALDYAQQRIESMATNLARFSDQKAKLKTLNEEVANLTSSLQLVTKEKEMISAQFEALASQPAAAAASTATGDGESLGKVLRENLQLKKELEKLRMKFIKRQEDYEVFHSKAGKQMTVLEGNWKKAEAEIRRLDQLFEHCTKIMNKVPSQMCHKDPNLKLLHDMFSSQ